MSDESYLCPEIEHSIQNQQKTGTITQWESRDPDVHVTVWSPPNHDVDHAYVYAVTVEVIRWVRRMPWSVYDPSQKWEYRLDLSDYKKRWCSSENTLTKCHVNSGETLTERATVQVRLIREEDWVKVLIHETLHAHRLDRIVEHQPEKIPFETETLVEAMARILYCQWMYSSPLAPPVLEANDWQSLLRRELTWMHQTCLFLRRTRWRAETHVQAYYLCTTAVLHSWRIFWKWLWSSTSESETGKKWPGVRDQAWTSYFGTTSSDVSLPGSQSSDSCASLKMVTTQVPVGTHRPRLAPGEEDRRQVQGGPILDTLVVGRFRGGNHGVSKHRRLHHSSRRARAGGAARRTPVRSSPQRCCRSYTVRHESVSSGPTRLHHVGTGRIHRISLEKGEHVTLVVFFIDRSGHRHIAKVYRALRSGAVIHVNERHDYHLSRDKGHTSYGHKRVIRWSTRSIRPYRENENKK